MNTAAHNPQRHTGLVWASATALLAVTAAVWPLVGQAQPPAPADGAAKPMHAKHHGPAAHGPGGLFGGPALQKMLDQAQASPEQRSKIEALMQQAREDLRAQQATGRETHRQLMQALAQPALDARAIEQLRQQTLVQHDKASQRMTQALVDTAQVLTPEQRARLSQHLARLDGADRPARTRGERPPQGTPPATAPATR